MQHGNLHHLLQQGHAPGLELAVGAGICAQLGEMCEDGGHMDMVDDGGMQGWGGTAQLLLLLRAVGCVAERLGWGLHGLCRRGVSLCEGQELVPVLALFDSTHEVLR